ncbi:MAG: YhgN family NAAT transporter [Thermoanaerobaculia bacterium]|nr:YhgN family NAAT transporter [Thermoanaerobaculia bacterium]MCZ7652294.1 YhgN family NAAT transporter [Thermoanaerobaculia bacterium]
MTFSSAAILLFLVMDPLGNVPLFVSALATVPPERRLRVLVRELLIALGVLLAFLFGGNATLNLLGIRSESISVAGGIVLFLISIKMLFPTAQGASEGPAGEPFIVPLAIPLMAGPSTFATLILLSGQAGATPGLLVAALLAAWVASSAILLASPWFHRILGPRGLLAMERLMGLLLVALSVQMLLDGVAATFR